MKNIFLLFVLLLCVKRVNGDAVYFFCLIVNVVVFN